MHFLRVKKKYKSFQMVLTCPIMHFLWDQKRYKGVTFERGSPQ